MRSARLRASKQASESALCMLRKTRTISDMRLPSGAATHAPCGIFAGSDVRRSAPSRPPGLRNPDLP
eukprot:7294645-Alexandrium_andersonii.AAC.1